MRYAEAIKKLRLSMCLTQTEFGELFNVKFGTVCRWELGEFLPTMKTRRQLLPYFEKYKIDVMLD